MMMTRPADLMPEDGHLTEINGSNAIRGAWAIGCDDLEAIGDDAAAAIGIDALAARLARRARAEANDLRLDATPMTGGDLIAIDLTRDLADLIADAAAAMRHPLAATGTHPTIRRDWNAPTEVDRLARRADRLAAAAAATLMRGEGEGATERLTAIGITAALLGGRLIGIERLAGRVVHRPRRLTAGDLIAAVAAAGVAGSTTAHAGAIEGEAAFFAAGAIDLDRLA